MNSSIVTFLLLAVRRDVYPRVCLTAGLVLLTGAALASEQASATDTVPSGTTINQPVNEFPAQRLLEKPQSFAPVVEKVAPAVVKIVTSIGPASPGNLASGGQGPAARPFVGRVSGGASRRLLGAGVVVTEDGYILTNAHLIGEPGEVNVTLHDGREFKPRVIGVDARTDIAVIKIDAQHLPTVPLAQSENVRVGDIVLAIGHPFGVGQSVTHGIVSATNRGGLGIEDYESFIQTDAPINPGDSGGALVDIQGRLIGINTAILSRSGGNLGIAFAIPSDLVRRVMTDLVTFGRVFRGYLGVEAQDLTPELGIEFNLQGATGVLVGGVPPKGPAEMAGLKVGDVITHFDGKPVRDTHQVRLSVAEGKPCQPVQVDVLRNGSAKRLRVILGQAPDVEPPADVERFAKQEPGALRGVTIIELTNPVRQLLNIPRHVQGAVVLDLRAYSAAAQAGLRPGDVIESINRQEIRSVEETSRLTETTAHKNTLLRVWNNEGSHFIVVNAG